MLDLDREPVNKRCTLSNFDGPDFPCSKVPNLSSIESFPGIKLDQPDSLQNLRMDSDKELWTVHGVTNLRRESNTCISDLHAFAPLLDEYLEKHNLNRES